MGKAGRSCYLSLLPCGLRLFHGDCGVITTQTAMIRYSDRFLIYLWKGTVYSRLASKAAVHATCKL